MDYAARLLHVTLYLKDFSVVFIVTCVESGCVETLVVRIRGVVRYQSACTVPPSLVGRRRATRLPL